MQGALARLTAVAIGVGSAVVVTAGGNSLLGRLSPSKVVCPTDAGQWPEWPNARLQEDGPSRSGAVLAEIAGLSAHSWAGVYRTRCPYGDSDELALAPLAGFTLHEGNSECGNCNRYSAMGKVLAQEGAVLKLEVEVAEAENPGHPSTYRLDDRLHLVPWGDFVFAVPARTMESFCAEVTGGLFPNVPFRPRGELAGFDCENVQRPAGKPRVPGQFEHLLPDEPISCGVAALVESRQRQKLCACPTCGPSYDVVYTIDAGSQAGIAPGMHLFIEAETGWTFAARVESVEASKGIVETTISEEQRSSAESLVGRKASTLHPWANRQRR